MKRQLTILFLAIGSVCLFAPGLPAQDLGSKVPFAFHVGVAACQSGKYLFEKNMAGTIQIVRNADTGRALLIANNPASSGRSDHARLVFRRYGSEYFLREIWDSEGRGSSLPMSKLERQVQEGTPTREVASTTVYLAAAR